MNFKFFLNKILYVLYHIHHIKCITRKISQNQTNVLFNYEHYDYDSKNNENVNINT